MSNEEKDLDVLDILLDEENDDDIVLFDAKENKEIRFEQVAIIPKNQKIYAILKPIDEMEDVNDDEAIVFVVDYDAEGRSMLVIETDEKIATEVFDDYYTLLDAAEADTDK